MTAHYSYLQQRLIYQKFRVPSLFNSLFIRLVYSLVEESCSRLLQSPSSPAWRMVLTSLRASASPFLLLSACAPSSCLSPIDSPPPRLRALFTPDLLIEYLL